ncbi:MAG: IS110 family transposase [Crocinitomicaceae bacterium]|nr:IS110 family transposase [Crocinitomicaceae bacterium]
MNKIIRQSVGIDVSQKKLDIAISGITDELEVSFSCKGIVENNRRGFAKLLSLVRKHSVGVPIVWVMEATGVYHEKLAYFLFEQNCQVSIVLPNKISNYMRTLTIKTITDKISSMAIAQFGLERKVQLWNPPQKIYQNLRHLTRERDQIVYERASIKNQLHAEKKQAYPLQSTIKRLEKRIKFLNQQELEIKSEISVLLKENPDVDKEVNRLTTIPGIGIITAVTILAETNGFELIENKKQLVSYTGLDIKEKLSGTSINGRPRISKKGNKHIRKALYLPSLAAVRSNEKYKSTYARIVARSGIKKKGLVAIQRRLLEVCFLLYKRETNFDLEYDKK